MTTQVKITLGPGTGLPEDNIVNTLHFGTTGAPPVATPLTLALAVEEFYNVDAPNETRSIANFIGPGVSRSVLASRMDFYDLNDPQPRVPYFTHRWTLGIGDDPTGLPAEDACVLSWTAAPVSGVPAGRLRGRTFIGPLGQEAATTALGLVRPNPTLIDVMVESGNRLRIASGGAGGNLVVYSSTSIPARASVITKVHVDNAFDTQRRRGLAPTARRILPLS